MPWRWMLVVLALETAGVAYGYNGTSGAESIIGWSGIHPFVPLPFSLGLTGGGSSPRMGLFCTDAATCWPLGLENGSDAKPE